VIFYLHDIYSLILFSSVIFLLLYVGFDKKRVLLLLEHVVNQKYIVTYSRNNLPLFNGLAIMVYLTVLTTIMSIFLTYKTATLSIVWFLIILSSLITLETIKTILTSWLSIILEQTSLLHNYRDSIKTNNLFLSIIFLPIFFVLTYIFDGQLINTQGFKVGVLFVVMFFLLQFIVLKRLNLLNRNLLFYLILYLYVFEIAPYLVLFKLFQNIQ